MSSLEESKVIQVHASSAEFRMFSSAFTTIDAFDLWKAIDQVQTYEMRELGKVAEFCGFVHDRS